LSAVASSIRVRRLDTRLASHRVERLISDGSTPLQQERLS